MGDLLVDFVQPNLPALCGVISLATRGAFLG
jgi:hypothetical protein